MYQWYEFGKTQHQHQHEIDFLWHSRILHVIYISVFHVDAYIISLVNEHLILSLYDSDS